MSELLPREKNFVHLHNHTEYSMLDGAARIGEMFEVAREMGIPTIVGITGLIATLESGQHVTMDGSAGTVKIAEPTADATTD